MANVIETEKLTKSYGSHRGIIEVDLAVQEGEVFGFLGPNGAGKTTTIRTLLDLIRPTSGDARVFGIESRGRPGRDPSAGRLPARASSPSTTGSRAAQHLEYFANLRGGVDQAYQARWSSASTSTRRGSSRSTGRATSRRWAWSSPSSTARTC